MVESRHERHATDEGEFHSEGRPGGGASDRAADEAREGGAADHSAPESLLESVERERDELRANWKRSQADYQNLRRRLQSDIDAALQHAKKPLLQNLLLVLDYLEMALATPCTTQECKDLRAGVELTRSALLDTLERENLRAIPEGGTFDTALHEAVERVETAGRENGEIVQTLRRGYTFNGQVLRPAQVKVAVALDAQDSKQSARKESR